MKKTGIITLSLPLCRKHLLAPAFIYTNDDLDGDAMSGDAYDFQLSYGYRSTPVLFDTSANRGYISSSSKDRS